jgi:hypothetical protein
MRRGGCGSPVQALWISRGRLVEKLWMRCGRHVSETQLPRPERSWIVKRDLLASAVAGASAATWLAAFFALLAGKLTRSAGAAALAGGLVVAVAAVLSSRNAPGEGRWSKLEILALIAFFAASLRQFGWLCFERDGWLLTLLPYNYGDLPLHWTYVQHMAGGAAFWPENPIMTGERLRYPLGVDLLSAVLVQLGASVPGAFVSLGLAGAALTALALRRWGGALGVAGLLFSGGLAGFQILWTGRLVDYQDGVAWKNLFLALFVTQRGFLLALPAGLLLLWSWRRRFLRGEPALAAWVEAALWGALPLIHLHSFLFVSIVGAVWGLGAGRWRRGLPSLGLAFLPASWAVWEVTDRFRAAGLVGWKPGWMIGGANPAVFLLVNFGVWLPLAFVALAIALLARRREDGLVLAPALGIFALLFLVRAAPWEWDNTKLMLWSYLVTLPALGSVVLRRLPRPASAAVVVLLLFSGAVGVLAASLGRGPRLELLNRAEYAAVCGALAGVGPDERVATVQTHNHPVALCGHALVAGYSGQLWSHGIDARDVERDLASLLAGAPDWPELARRLDARYLFWGEREQAAYPLSPRPWSQGAVATAGRWGTLYRLR